VFPGSGELLFMPGAMGTCRNAGSCRIFGVKSSALIPLTPFKRLSRIWPLPCVCVDYEKVIPMLRVSYSETADGQCWNLYGRLAGPWVDELRTCWRHARKQAPLADAVIDLKEVTFIDPAGERLLAEMASAGAVLVAAGVANNHLVASLMAAGNLDSAKSEVFRAKAEESTPQGGVK
jgi:hypothetical protein